MSASTALILGAGFSHVAGLPLAKDLFESEFLIPSREARRRYEAVLREWRAWKSIHLTEEPEQFLSELYRAATRGPVPWAWAAELVAAILATPLPQDRGPYQARYSGRITRPVNVADHEAFWAVVCSHFRMTVVVTTNYDILIERGLRHRSMRRGNRPGMYYGGLARPQVLKGTALPFSAAKPERLIELKGNIPVYKLHGSLNWGLEAGALQLYQDLRPAFRRGGHAQIVPPVVEKEAPRWLLDVWEGAREALSSSATWLVCGYSLPTYDRAITQLLADAGTRGTLARIVLLDPYSIDLAPRWQAVAPNARLHLLPGLPQGLHPLLELAG